MIIYISMKMSEDYSVHKQGTLEMINLVLEVQCVPRLPAPPTPGQDVSQSDPADCGPHLLTASRTQI